MNCRSIMTCAATLAMCALSASAATIQVGPTRTYTTVQAGYNAASSGDVIEIDSGTYFQSAGWVYVNGKHNLTFRGVGPTRPVIDAGNSNLRSKGIFVIEIGTNNITIENLELKNTRLNTTGANAAGVRAQGTNLTLRNCYIHDCDNGVLNGTGHLLFEYCEFARNGYGDGQSHNMYVGGESFTLRHCYVHDAYNGHEVKTRAKVNYILYNRISNETGTAGRELQLANGGTAYVIGNVIYQGNGGNSQIITYGDEYGISPGANPNPYLYIMNNTIVNNRVNGAVFIYNADAGATALVQNNIFLKRTSGTQTILNGAATMVTNWETTDAGVVNAAGYDYRLTAASTGAINAGTAAGFGFNSYPLTPAYQYIHSAAREDRPADAAIDIGAYEYVVPNQQPAVSAGNDVTAVYEGRPVALHAAGSDPDAGDVLSYLWTQTAGKAVSLTGSTAADVSFTAPALATKAESLLTFQVQVDDGKGGSATDSVSVQVYMKGDATRDHKVNVFDLQRLGASWNKQLGDAGYDGACDFTGDNKVNVFDLQAMGANWNRTLP